MRLAIARVAIPLLALGAALGTLASAAPDTGSANITIYRANSTAAAGAAQVQRTPGAGDFAVVTERRRVTVDASGNARVEGVSQLLDVASLAVRVTDDPGAQVLEQSFAWDLGSVDQLLERHVGQAITVVTDGGEVRGILRRVDAQVLVLETQDQAAPMVVVDRAHGVRDVKLGAAPGLAARPTLVLKLKGARAGEHTVELTYQTPGLAWDADYVAIADDAGKKVDLSGWVRVQNQTGASWDGATLRLVSGEPLRAATPVAPGQVAYDANGNPITAGTPAPPAMRSYDLAAPIALGDGDKQAQLFAPAAGLVAATIYFMEYTPQYAYYYRQQGYPLFDQNMDGYGVKKIEQLSTQLEVDLKQKGAPGVDLPPGHLKVYRRDAKSGALALVAEDDTGHQAKDGALRVRLGTSRDLTAERKQLEFRLDDRAREMREKMEVRFKNTRKDAVEVVVSESLWRWRNWSIEGESAPYVKSDDGTRALFRVKVPAGGEAVLTYTAKYHSW